LLHADAVVQAPAAELPSSTVCVGVAQAATHRVQDAVRTAALGSALSVGDARLSQLLDVVLIAKANAVDDAAAAPAGHALRAVRAYRVIGFDRSADVLVERGCAAGGWSSVLDVAGVVARGRLSAGQAGQVVQDHGVGAVVLTREVRVGITATQGMAGGGGCRRL